ncbi:MAG: outer membrane protein assembly factor BamA [Gammaproteobacteria bacterium]|nr:MAG: outer membrane protein assembly factor BamA [Gammaproteobacteria bacterium]
MISVVFKRIVRQRLPWLVLALLLPLQSVWAESFVVEDIRIEGLQRVSAGVVFAALPLGIRDTVNESDLPRLARALFQTGNFDDVQLGRDGQVLVIVVQERPAISTINISGNKILETDSLKKALKNVNLTEGQVFKRSTLESIQLELQRQYVSQGRYDASITTDVVLKPRNRVAIDIDIDEGSVAIIKQINIVGNSVFPNDLLLGEFELTTGGWLSFITGDNKYSKEKLTGDLEKLKSYYMDRGYINFDVESTQVSISPDREGVYITIHVEEGALYTVKGYELSGDIILPEAELKRFVMLREGVVFSQRMMTGTEESLTRRLGNEGYTFAKVTGIPEVDETSKTVTVKFFVDPGKRAYVRRIEFRGNTKTVDEVLRREMRQMEGGVASSAQMEQSKVRLERLGFFKEVQVESTEVPGTDDFVDVVYTVEEQPSGSIGASIGFSQDSGLILGANLQQNNFLGTGKQVGVGLSRSDYQELYRFSYVNPYYTEDGVSRGFSVFYRSTNLDEANVASYTADSLGGLINFGYPIKETERLGFSFGYTKTEITTGIGPVQEIRATPTEIPQFDEYIIDPIVEPTFDTNGNLLTPAIPAVTGGPPIPDALYVRGEPGFLDLHGDEFDDFPFTISWIQSELNRGRLATRGHSQQVSLQLSLPGSDNEYFKLSYSGQLFVPLTRTLTLRFRGDLGYGDGYGDTEELPFWEHYFAGGFSSVRGFKSNTLGPLSTPALRYSIGYTTPITDANGRIIELRNPTYILDPNTGKLAVEPVYYDEPDPFGGNILVEGSVELLFPLPFVKDQRSVRSAFFLDAGNVFSSNCRKTQLACSDLDLGELRYSVGVGLTWITGFGPLTFSLAKPLNDGKYDDTEVFQFSLGQSF